MTKRRSNQKKKKKRFSPLQETFNAPLPIPVSETTVLESRAPFYFLLAGLFLIVYFFLAFSTNARWYLPGVAIPLGINPWLYFWFGILLLFFGFRNSRNYPAADDISKWKARLLLLLFLVCAAVIHLYRMEEPVGMWWADLSAPLSLDWGVIYGRHIPMVVEHGVRPFLDTLVRVVALLFFPGLTGSATHSVSSTIVDIFSLLIFYLLGKEAGNRRTGLFVVAIGVISREMLLKDWICVLPLSIFGYALGLLVFLRLIYKPTFWRFIQWGALTAFGLYTYNGLRSWALFSVVCVVFWVLSHSKEREAGVWGYTALLGSSAVWFLWFLHANGLILNVAYPHLYRSYYWFLLILIVLTFICWLKIKPIMKLDGRGRLSVGLALGLIAAGLVFYPLSTEPLFNPFINQCVKKVLIDFKPLLNPAVLFKYSIDQVGILFKVFFLRGGDIPEIGPGQVTFFSLHTTVFIFLGLAWALARPNKNALWIIFASLPGILLWIIIVPRTSAFMLGVIPPLFLLSAMGLERFWGIFNSKNRSWVLAFFLGIFWVWAGWANYQCVREWMGTPVRPVIVVFQQTRLESPNNRVYVAHANDYHFGDLDSLVAHQKVYVLRSSNPIYVPAGEKLRDVVVIYREGNKELEKLLRREFPAALWTPVESGRKDYPGTVLQKVKIPATQITSDNQKLFFFQEEQPDQWIRKFYHALFGVGQGMIHIEDCVKDPCQPFPFGAPDIATCRLDKEWKVEKTGYYEFSIQSFIPVHLTLKRDKQLKIFNFISVSKTQRKATRRVWLKAGIYHAQYRCGPFVSRTIPRVQVRTAEGVDLQW